MLEVGRGASSAHRVFLIPNRSSHIDLFTVSRLKLSTQRAPNRI